MSNDFTRNFAGRDFENIPEPPKDSLTCYDCPNRDDCKYVDDWYNTDGDCLALK